MNALLLLPFVLLMTVTLQGPVVSDQPPPMDVVSQKWSRERQSVDQAQTMVNAPAPAMIQANKNFELQRRNNMPPGDRDPNKDTLDGRSAAMEKSVQDARAPKPIDGFSYRAKLKNTSNKVVEILFWEYEFTEPAATAAVSRRQFLCATGLKPGQGKELKGFSLSGPSDVISIDALSKSGTDSKFQEKVLINRIEYADGSIWQRKGWNFGAVRLSYQRAVNTPWAPDMCKAL